MFDTDSLFMHQVIGAPVPEWNVYFLPIIAGAGQVVLRTPEEMTAFMHCNKPVAKIRRKGNSSRPWEFLLTDKTMNLVLPVHYSNDPHLVLEVILHNIIDLAKGETGDADNSPQSGAT